MRKSRGVLHRAQNDLERLLTVRFGPNPVRLSLKAPLDRKWLQKLGQADSAFLVAVQDRLYPFGRQQSEPNDAGYVGWRDAFAHSQLGDCWEGAGIQHPLPSERPSKCLEDCAVCPKRNLRAVRQLHLLPSTTPHNVEQYVKRNDFGVLFLPSVGRHPGPPFSAMLWLVLPVLC